LLEDVFVGELKPRRVDAAANYRLVPDRRNVNRETFI